MSQLLDIITGALDGIDVDGAIGGEAGNLLAIAGTVAQLTQGQPPALGDFVSAIAELDLPDFNFAGDLTQQIGQIRDLVPTDVADLLGPITQALGNIDSSLGDGVDGIIAPLVNAFRAIQSLLHTSFDFSGDAGGGGGGGGGGSTPPSGIVSSNPETRIDPAKVQAFQSELTELPAQPSVASLLQWFNDSVTIGRGDMVELAVRSIPYLDDVRTPLSTVLGWQTLSAADFQTQINGTLQALTLAIGNQTGAGIVAQVQALTTSAQALNLVTLRQTVLDIQTQLQALKTHIDADTLNDGNLTTIETAIAGLISQRDTLALQFNTSVKQALESQLKLLAVLPERLQEKMAGLVLLLQPPARFTAGGTGAQTSSPTSGLPGLDNFLDQYRELFENLAATLDISDVTDAFTAPAEAIENAVTEIDEAITMVTLEITGRLNQVQSLIAAVDLAGIVDTAEQAIEDFTDSIVGDLTTAFATVRTAIE
ncbi:MAG: hypothetical protein ACOY7J_22885, partial [Pseudomonadota bacterium]